MIFFSENCKIKRFLYLDERLSVLLGLNFLKKKFSIVE